MSWIMGSSSSSEQLWTGLDWIGLDWTGLDWIGRNGTGRQRAPLFVHSVCWTVYLSFLPSWWSRSVPSATTVTVGRSMVIVNGVYGMNPHQRRLNWIELNWIELNWIELNWIELNWNGSDQDGMSFSFPQHHFQQALWLTITSLHSDFTSDFSMRFAMARYRDSTLSLFPSFSLSSSSYIEYCVFRFFFFRYGSSDSSTSDYCSSGWSSK